MSVLSLYSVQGKKKRENKNPTTKPKSLSQNIYKHYLNTFLNCFLWQNSTGRKGKNTGHFVLVVDDTQSMNSVVPGSERLQRLDQSPHYVPLLNVSSLSTTGRICITRSLRIIQRFSKKL